MHPSEMNFIRHVTACEVAGEKHRDARRQEKFSLTEKNL